MGVPLFLAVTACLGQESVPEARHAAIAEALTPSLVQVEYTLQYDKGEAPRAVGWVERCPNCGRYHNALGDFEELIREERPLQAAGFLVSPTQVVTRDLMMHPRFIKKVVVRHGNEAAEARPESYARDQVAVILTLDRTLPGTKPLIFDAGKPPPYVAVSRGQRQGILQVSVRGLSPGEATHTWDSRHVWTAPFPCLIADADGTPVGLAMRDELPLDDSWKGSPLNWPAVTAKEMDELLAAREAETGQAVVRVALSFRSPKQIGGKGYWEWDADNRSSSTEQNVAGVLVDANRALVLWESKPKITARLTRIKVHQAKGEAVPAKFVGTLRDYGGFIAELEKPLAETTALATEDVRGLRDKLMLGAEITFQGEKRVAYFDHVRVSFLEPKWKGQVFPRFVGGPGSIFAYDTSGRLAAIPISRRERTTERERWSGSERSLLLPAQYLKDILADLPANIDPSNVPLEESQENRLAWMGVTLQGLDKELARAQNVSDLTRDGETGALVSYVYPDSPAAKAGIEPGFILLRLYVEGEPKPLEVKVEHEEERSFPWEMLDEAPEEAFEQMPTPWPPAEDEFTRALTDLGLGRKYTAELFRDGKVVKKDFEIVQSPPQFDSAPRYKSQALGLTIRDFTYEVRRYFQKKADDPGVVVSKIEPGSKAAVAGIKPYELITHVNDSPVRDVKDFERLITDQPELRLAVKRLVQGRIVKITMSLPASQPAASQSHDGE
jgi:hypothetical protein